MSQHHLPLGNLRHTFLNRVARHKSIDHYLISLTNSMSSGEGLNIIMRIPIGVIDNNGVGCCQVYTQTSCPVKSRNTHQTVEYNSIQGLGKPV
ncbi:hypothetical protein L798_00514 [Zootermopsis nevadensis]|uniref:Uncharacterized protein n=1 Tax=Zootermopsis nevadensis TaxID=136037 RepID=A0A067QKF3_ZOONE|nr:hypothetical protein L798_00514 [Zootermopsis nevadensis]